LKSTDAERTRDRFPNPPAHPVFPRNAITLDAIHGGAMMRSKLFDTSVPLRDMLSVTARIAWDGAAVVSMGVGGVMGAVASVQFVRREMHPLLKTGVSVVDLPVAAGCAVCFATVGALAGGALSGLYAAFLPVTAPVTVAVCAWRAWGRRGKQESDMA
jgi:hypothetical protein